jgi:hypothetical protein
MGANKEQILSIIRYSLTTIGTILVTTGTLNSLMVFQIGGGIWLSEFGQFLTKQILNN